MKRRQQHGRMIRTTRVVAGQSFVVNWRPNDLADALRACWKWVANNRPPFTLTDCAFMCQQMRKEAAKYRKSDGRLRTRDAN